MPYIKVDKENSGPVHVYYEDHGSGQPVVLIHGFPMNGEAWEKQKLALLKAGYRTITYDRRGFGKSDKPAFGYDYDTFTADLDKVLEQLDLRDVILMGHSMGTGEAVHYLGTRGSKRISRAILVSVIAPYLLKTDDNPEGVDQSIFNGIKEAIAQDRPKYISQFFQDFYNLDQNLGTRVSQEVVNANWNVGVEASPKGTYDCVDAWLTDFRPDLSKIDVPVLIVHGTDDRILPFEATAGRLESLIKDCTLVAIDGAPHGLPWAYAEDVNSAMLAFVGTPAMADEKASMRRPEPAFGEAIDETIEIDETE